MHDNIKKHMGFDWLEKQMEKEKGNIYINDDKIKAKIINNFFTELDKLVGELSDIDGFSRWVDDVIPADEKGVADLIAELMCFKTLIKTSDKLTLKVDNSEGRNVEALIVKGVEELYIEVLNMREISTTPKKKVHGFFKKAKKKFTDKKGILIVCCEKFHKDFNPSPEMVLEEPLTSLIREISLQFRDGTNEKTEGIVLAIINLANNPDNDWSVGVDRRFILLPKPKDKGGPDPISLMNLFDMKEYFVQESLLPKNSSLRDI